MLGRGLHDVGEPLGPPGRTGRPRRAGPQRSSSAAAPTASRICLEITESVLMEEASVEIDARAARPRRPPLDRRLRHRLLVARLPQALPGRLGEGRPLVRRRARHRRRGLGDRRRGREPRVTRSGCRSSPKVSRPAASSRALLDLGCDRAQGYWFSGPRAAAEFAGLLNQQPWVDGPRRNGRFGQVVTRP